MKLRSYWLDTAKPAGDFRQAPLPPTVDVAVVGGGLTGLSTALHLARHGASVAVLESQTLGWGASGRNGGMATTGLAIGFDKAVKRYGSDAAQMFLAYNDAIDTVEDVVRTESIDCDFRRSGKLTLAYRPSHFEGFGRTAELMQEHAGHTVRLVPRDELGEEIGTDFYHGAMLDPLAAGVHVGKLVMGIASAAANNGVSLHEDCEVVELERVHGTRHRVVTTQGSLETDNVVMATSGYSGGVMPWLRRRIVPIGSFIIATEPLPDELVAEIMPTRRVAADSKNLLYYFRITPDNRMLFGGRARFALSSAGSDLKSGAILHKAMTSVFPQLGPSRVDYCWGGLVDMTLDQMVHAGERNGIHYSVGYSGHGVQMATHMGKVMADVLAGDDSTNPWRNLRFPAVPGHVGPPWFLPPVGAYFRAVDAIK